MNRCAILATAMALWAVALAHAAPVTCANLKTQIATNIHKGGDRVAVPTYYPGTSPLTSEIHGIDYVSGDLDCDAYAGDQPLIRLKLKTEWLREGDRQAVDQENDFRLNRAVSLVAATLCATEDRLSIGVEKGL
ncbi:hypothetical protein SAMN05519104_4371 [Rhizobiales bacterium GAS188]|nr:hypothetical protein SAMN05519104_4371 [Rhizobiales bacterium GAS188]